MSDLAIEILSKATAVAPAAEVFITQSENTPVIFEANRLKGIQNKEGRTIALRILKDGRVGFASSNKLDNLDWLVQTAVETSQFGAPADYNLAVQSTFPTVDSYDPGVEQINLSQMVETGQQMINYLLAHTPELVCDAHLNRHKSTVIVVNSEGLTASYTRSAFSLDVEGTLISGTDMLFVGDGENSCHPIVDTQRILESIRLQLERSKTLTTTKSDKMPVIFSPNGVASALVSPLFAAFNGKLVLEGASPLEGKLGLAMFDEKIELYDDATVPFRPSSSPFDDEGTPCQCLSLIKDCAPQNFLYDLKTAAQAQKKSTGHGIRGGGLPVPSAKAFVFRCGKTSPDDMIADIKEGLFIEQVMGATQGNILGGDFSGNILLGYKIQNGRLVGRVKDTMVFGNVYELLKNATAIGSDGRWVGSNFFAPSFYFPALSVSSK